MDLSFSGTRRFVLYVGDGADGEMELFDGSEAEAWALYRRILEGDLAAIHLFDVVRDARYAPKFS